MWAKLSTDEHDAIYRSQVRTSENSVKAKFAEFFFHVSGERSLRPTPIGPGARERDDCVVGYYVSYVQIWQARGLSVHKTTPVASGRGKAKAALPGGMREERGQY
jgi:hypothetical protein